MEVLPNAIPVKQNLKRRHILNEDVCDLCKLETELVVLTAHTGLGLNSFIFVLPNKSIFLNKEVFTYAHKEQKNSELLASVMWSL